MRDAILLDPVADPRWLDFVNGHKLAGIFHHPAWLGMLSAVYGYKPLAVCLQESGHVTAGIPFVEVKSYITGQRWVSVPFSDHCRPLLSPKPDEDLESFVTYLRHRVLTDVPRIEVRWGLEAWPTAFTERSFVYHLLELEQDPKHVFGRFGKSQVQRGIARSQREKVNVVQCKEFNDFRPFYNLQLKTRKRLGVPAQPKKFFVALWEHVLAPGFGFALIAYKDKKAVAGAVFLKFGRTVTYKFGASDYTLRTHRANHAVFWEAIQQACVDGYSWFDFGRTDRSNLSLISFKRDWGTTEHDLDYTILSKSPPKGRSSSVRNLVGGIIKHSPRFVCRLSGELFYKHFA